MRKLAVELQENLSSLPGPQAALPLQPSLSPSVRLLPDSSPAAIPALSSGSQKWSSDNSLHKAQPRGKVQD